MTINFNIDKKDFVKFCSKHMAHTDTGKKHITDLKINVIGICLIIYIMFLFSRIADKTAIKYILICISIFILLLGKALMHFKFKIILRRLYNRSEYRELFIKTAVTLNDDGIKYETDDSRSFYNWSEIKGIHKIDNFIIINCYKPIILPVSCFDSDSEKDQFLKIVCDNSDWAVNNIFPENFVFV